MASIGRDLRIALRSLLRTPGFTAAAVLTLALGIGAPTAIYTVLKRVVLDPLPYPEAERLVRLINHVPGVEPDAQWDMAAAQYFYLGEQASSFEEIGAYNAVAFNVQTPEGPRRVRGAMVSFSAMGMIGARSALGRSIAESDDNPGATPVAVLSDGFWRREFGGDPDVVGSTLEIFSMPIEIVGVLEPGVELPAEPGTPLGEGTDLWIPIASIDSRFNPEGPFQNNHTTPMFARLAPGVSLDQAQAELDRLTIRLPEAFPNVYSQEFFERYGFRTQLYPMKEYVVGRVAESLWVLLGAVAIVLLIACANVANLLLVRVESRRRELAIRSALGASPGAIARRLLAEGFALALLGGILGVLLTLAGTRALVGLAPDDFPRLGDLRVDGGVALFGFGLSLLATLMVGIFPIVRARSETSSAALADGGRATTTGRERQRVRSGLVIAQVALALVLIIGAGLLVESFRRLRALDPGVDPDGVVVVELNIAGERYPDSRSRWRFYDAVLEGMRSLPGVTSVGISQTVPFTGGYGCTVQGFEDQRVYERLAASEMTTCAGQEPTSPGYFEAMGIPLLRGRTFTDADNDQPSTGAVIVSEAFANRFWPGEDPIGKGVGPSGQTDQPFYRVVGVVGDVYSNSPTEEPAVAIYYPIVPIPETTGWSASTMNLVVRTERGSPTSLLPEIRQAVQEVDPTIPLANAREMQSLVDGSMSRVTFAMTLLGIAAAMALLLAGIGIYGVVSYMAARRTTEIGVRMALGARKGQVERLVLGGSAKLVTVGLVVGGGAALLLTRLMRGLLYGVEPTHPVSFLSAALLLLAVGLLATYLPARRATRVDPIAALRAE
ncbi:MAG: FtsX-like permease family protein [Gemmatimonas sp.]|nr:FtsX-like permease family protein [Gemmatimonas sp.]